LGNADKIFAKISTEQDIEALIVDSESENLWLDFKDASFPPGDDFKKNLGKYISGFSNSDGGVLVYGVKETKEGDKKFLSAPSKLYVDYEKRIQDLISRTTSPINSGVLVKSILSLNQERAGYVVVLIPKSENPPIQDIHQKKYFKRAGESHVPLEHYEIADFFGRRMSPLLKVTGILKTDVNNQDGLLLEIFVKNEGRAVAKFPFIQFFSYGSFRKDTYTSSWFGNPISSKIDKFYSSNADMVIHTDISVFVERFCIHKSGIEFGKCTSISGRVGCDGMQTRDFELIVCQPEVYEIHHNKTSKEIFERIKE